VRTVVASSQISEALNSSYEHHFKSYFNIQISKKKKRLNNLPVDFITLNSCATSAAHHSANSARNSLI